MSDEEKLQELLKLKRYETPGKDYFDRFALEFRKNQDARQARPSGLSLVGQWILMFRQDVFTVRWGVATASFAAVLLISFLAYQGRESPISENHPSTSSSEIRKQLLEVKLPQPEQADSLSPGSQGKAQKSERGFLPAKFFNK